MPTSKQSQPREDVGRQSQWQSIYIIGAIAVIIGLIGFLADIALGTATGGNLSALPQTAVERFAQLQANPLLGLYNLDLLNTLVQIIMIPAYFAIYAAHHKEGSPHALLALIVFLVASAIFITTNTALPMLELSTKYAASTTDSQKLLFAAAGEAMLARGAHGSLGVLIGFMLPIVASLMMSFAMLSGRVFSRATAYAGIAGSVLLLLYVILVTFAPATKDAATAFAMPGGLLMMAWQTMATIKLFRLGRQHSG